MRILYHTPLSPYCRKVRLLLAEKGLEFDLTLENVWEQRLEFFALNPAGEVPVLMEPDGEVISGNYSITEYLEEAYRETNFIGATITDRLEIRRLIDWFDHKFDQEVTQNILFEKVYRRLMRWGEPNSDVIRVGKKNILYHLDYIAYLTQDKRFLTGDTLSLADFAAAAHISSLDYLGDVPWDHNPKAKDWYALIKSRPSMRAILEERIMSIRPPEWYENPDF
jgi:glutathione S-transferase